MKKQDLATLTSSIALLISIGLLIKYKKGFWWYAGAFIIIAPIAGSIGYSLGKDDKEVKKKVSQPLKPFLDSNYTGNNIFPLIPGSKGKEVEQLQLYLKAKYGATPKNGYDGIFGQDTLNNIKSYLNVSEVSEHLFNENRMGTFLKIIKNGEIVPAWSRC